MHIIVIIAALLLMIPAALAGIISGLAQCLSHRPDFTTALEHATAFLTALGPFGSGLVLTASSLLALVILTLTAFTLLNRTR